jgi:hypothetical protein
MEDKKLAISFLAYGEEHIEELKNILKDLEKHKNKFDFFITTNEKSNFCLYNVTDINLPFNYNLKRFPIKDALLNYDSVLFIDTDHTFKKDNVDLNFIEELEDGIYVNLVDTVDGIKYENKISLDDFLNYKVSTGINIDYFKKINDLNYNKKELFFIRESFFLIKLTDKNKKLEFINTWDDLVNKIDFNNLINNQIGIMEGLIIYLTCLKTKINIYEIEKNKKLLKIYNNFNHLGDYNSIHILDKKLF